VLRTLSKNGDNQLSCYTSTRTHNKNAKVLTAILKNNARRTYPDLSRYIYLRSNAKVPAIREHSCTLFMRVRTKFRWRELPTIGGKPPRQLWPLLAWTS